MRSFTIVVNGHRYQASWKPLSDGLLEVRSYYGRTSVRLDGQDPGEVARLEVQRQIAARLINDGLDAPRRANRRFLGEAVVG